MAPACYRRNRSITGPLPAVMKIYRHAGNAVTKLCTSSRESIRRRTHLPIPAKSDSSGFHSGEPRGCGRMCSAPPPPYTTARVKTPCADARRLRYVNFLFLRYRCNVSPFVLFSGSLPSVRSRALALAASRTSLVVRDALEDADEKKVEVFCSQPSVIQTMFIQVSRFVVFRTLNGPVSCAMCMQCSKYIRARARTQAHPCARPRFLVSPPSSSGGRIGDLNMVTVIRKSIS